MKNSAKVVAISTLVFAVVTIAFGLLSLHKLQTTYSVMQFLPENHPALKIDMAVKKRFHIEDHPVFIGVLTLKKGDKATWLQPDHIKRLEKLTAKLKTLKGVDSAVSVANVEGAANVKGAISVGELVQLLPKQQWKERILNDNLLTPNLIAEDGRTVLIYVQLHDAEVNGLVSTETKFKHLLNKTFPEVISSVGGVPAVQTDLGVLLNKELINFLGLTILACALTLFLIFRTLSTIWIPLILVAYCNLMVFTMMAWTGITFTILSSTIPILVFIDVMTIATHILLRMHEESLQAPAGESRWRLIIQTNKRIWVPNILGSLTTCVGFLTLLLSDVPLIRTYGMGVAIAILLSSSLTSLGIMPLLLLFPLPEPRAWVHRPARWALWVIENRKPVILTTLAVCAVLAFCGRSLNWTGRLFDDLPKGQEARRSTEKIDRTMGGIVPLQVVVRLPKGKDWSDPVRIQTLDKLVADLRLTHGVGSALSLSDFLRASRLHNEALPTKRAAIAETYFLYGMSQNNPLTQYLTTDNRSARIELRIHDLPSNEVLALVKRIKGRVQRQFPDSQVQMGGMGAVAHIIHNEISKDLIFGFWQALILIVMLLTVIFRSLRWALVAALPNLIPPVVLLGYLALTHTPIKPGVAIIFSIALGLAFTNTVYAMNRLKSLRRKGGRLPVSRTFHLEGNPCLVATLVVMMGFSVFMFSYFDLNRTFGSCMIVSIIAGLVGDLIFLPALLKAAPWLLDSRKDEDHSLHDTSPLDSFDQFDQTEEIDDEMLHAA